MRREEVEEENNKGVMMKVTGERRVRTQSGYNKEEKEESDGQGKQERESEKKDAKNR